MTMPPDGAAVGLLALPGVTRADHHGRRSYRVGDGEVVAGVPADGVLDVLVGGELARAVTSGDATGVPLVWWGKELSGVRPRPAPRAPVDRPASGARSRPADPALRAAGDRTASTGPL